MNRRSKTDYGRIDNMTDEELTQNALDDPDNPPIDEEFWLNAPRVEPQWKKVPVNIRLSPEVVECFKARGPGYQTRINEVLERYVEHHKKQAANG